MEPDFCAGTLCACKVPAGAVGCGAGSVPCSIQHQPQQQQQQREWHVRAFCGRRHSRRIACCPCQSAIRAQLSGSRCLRRGRTMPSIPRACEGVPSVSAAASCGHIVVCYNLSSCISALQILCAGMCERSQQEPSLPDLCVREKDSSRWHLKMCHQSAQLTVALA